MVGMGALGAGGSECWGRCYVLPGAGYVLGTEWALLVGRFWRAARCRGLQSLSITRLSSFLSLKGRGKVKVIRWKGS